MDRYFSCCCRLWYVWLLKNQNTLKNISLSRLLKQIKDNWVKNTSCENYFKKLKLLWSIVWINRNKKKVLPKLWKRYYWKYWLLLILEHLKVIMIVKLSENFSFVYSVQNLAINLDLFNKAMKILNYLLLKCNKLCHNI